MVKLLSDICLGVVQTSLDKNYNAQNLPTMYKEVLLERICNHDQLTEAYTPHVARSLFSESLRWVNFYKCAQITDSILKLLKESRCKLECIIFSGCDNVTGKGIQNITQGQDQLAYLKLNKMKQISDEALLVVKSEKLRKVDLSNNAGLTLEGVAGLTNRNRNIRELSLWGIAESPGLLKTSHKTFEHAKTNHRFFISIAFNLGHRLEVLGTKLNQMCDDCLTELARYCPNLKELDLHGSSRISGEAVTKFSMGCTSLQSLDLSFCTQLCNTPDIEALWTLPTSLTSLSLTGLTLQNETIFVECLQRLRNLRQVKLCGVPVLNDTTLAKILESIGNSLTLLDMSGGVPDYHLTDSGLKAVSDYCYNLEALFLSLLSTPGCTGLLPLLQDPKRACKLKKLTISIRELSEEIVQEVVKNCHNLERLDMSGVRCVDDSILISLAHNSNCLKALSLKGCRQVTDVSVCELTRSCKLESLVLSGLTNLTDLSIFALANSCHYLHEIYLNGCCKISPVAVRYLIDCAIPRLFVNHATPNVSPEQLMAKNLDTGQFCRVDLPVVTR